MYIKKNKHFMIIFSTSCLPSPYIIKYSCSCQRLCLDEHIERCIHAHDSGKINNKQILFVKNQNLNNSNSIHISTFKASESLNKILIYYISGFTQMLPQS